MRFWKKETHQELLEAQPLKREAIIRDSIIHLK